MKLRRSSDSLQINKKLYKFGKINIDQINFDEINFEQNNFDEIICAEINFDGINFDEILMKCQLNFDETSMKF